MIVARICGGLGNQMFQYAFGTYLAKKHDCELVFDGSAFAGDPLRNYMLDRWAIEARFASEAERLLFPRRTGGQGWKNLLRGKRPLKTVKERPFGFRKKYLACPNHAYLDGYWQSEQFFPGMRQTLKRQFRPAKAINKLSQEIARAMHQGASVALHVRRADYVQNQVTNSMHGVCSQQYYEHCVHEILGRHEGVHLFIFSDDHPWCRQHMRFACKTTHVTHNSAENAQEDIWLMNQCRHHIIANSSFSWWGAWLREEEHGEVFAPSQWFANPKMDPRWVAPASWNKVVKTHQRTTLQRTEAA